MDFKYITWIKGSGVRRGRVSSEINEAVNPLDPLAQSHGFYTLCDCYIGGEGDADLLLEIVAYCNPGMH